MSFSVQLLKIVRTEQFNWAFEWNCSKVELSSFPRNGQIMSFHHAHI